LKLISLGKAAHHPLAGFLCQPLAAIITSQRLANRASQRLVSGLPQTNQLVGAYSGKNMVANSFGIRKNSF